MRGGEWFRRERERRGPEKASSCRRVVSRILRQQIASNRLFGLLQDQRQSRSDILSAKPADPHRVHLFFGNKMKIKYKQSATIETVVTTENNKNIGPTPSEVRGVGRVGGIVQSLAFTASRSSFFLCQLAAPILNLGEGGRGQSPSEDGGRETDRST